MLRLTELRLPLDHPDEVLRPAIVQRLGLHDAELLSFTVFRRNHDARRKSAIVLSYTIDLEVRDEPALLARLAGDRHLARSPDMRYRFVGHAPADFAAAGRPRPIVIGFGPCGIFAALILAQMGCGRSCWSVARRCVNARRTPGACGGAASSTPSRTCSSARAAPAPSPTASCGARSATHAT